MRPTVLRDVVDGGTALSQTRQLSLRLIAAAIISVVHVSTINDLVAVKRFLNQTGIGGSGGGVCVRTCMRKGGGGGSVNYRQKDSARDVTTT